MKRRIRVMVTSKDENDGSNQERRSDDSISEDKGHRLGNFHNYYFFNPVQNRCIILDNLNIFGYLVNQFLQNNIELDDDSFFDERNKRSVKRVKVTQEGNEGIKTKTMNHVINYCDLGCNEGDLSMEISRRLSKGTHSSIYCLGMDIDAELISRANHKHFHKHSQIDSSSVTDKDDFDTKINTTFQICNIADGEDFNSACAKYLQSIYEDNITTSTSTSVVVKDTNDSKNVLSTSTFRKFDLLSLFSTTMWIHINYGDDGLQSFLENICNLTNFLIIEPQPSKCYRSVNVRLRNMNRPEIDVSSTRLKLRNNIEQEIDKIIISCGFERVTESELAHLKEKKYDTKENEKEKFSVNKDDEDKVNVLGSTKNESNEIRNRTTWNRSLRLYKRSSISSI